MKYKIIFSLFLLSLVSHGYAQSTSLPKHDEVITITTPLGEMVGDFV